MTFFEDSRPQFLAEYRQAAFVVRPEFLGQLALLEHEWCHIQ